MKTNVGRFQWVWKPCVSLHRYYNLHCGPFGITVDSLKNPWLLQRYLGSDPYQWIITCKLTLSSYMSGMSLEGFCGTKPPPPGPWWSKRHQCKSSIENKRPDKQKRGRTQQPTLRMGHIHLRFRHKRFLDSGLCSPCLQLAHCPQFTVLWHPTHCPQGIHWGRRGGTQCHLQFSAQFQFWKQCDA